MDLFIFHYHFLTGGVTTSVRHALRAIRRHLPEIGRVELVGGRCAQGFPEELEREQASFRSLPEIDYRDPPREGRQQVAAAGRKLAALLLERFGGTDAVWWVHNHHLGKNPVFTQALLEVLSREQGQRGILQIHDFPECGRYANLRLLKRCLSLSPYPIRPYVRYAVLTPRDRAVLLEAGVPEELAFLLGNPVPAAPVPRAVSGTSDAGSRKQLRCRLAEAVRGEFPNYDPARPLMLYPVRTIRRKNVLEACLLARLPEEEPALAVTLPGVSRTEKPYSNRVEAAFRAGVCRGLWGVGGVLESAGLPFGELVAAADLVVSSAVQEGYGYLFVNSLQWRKPLLARDLEILEGTRELFAGYPAVLYGSVACPLGSGQRKGLRAAYRRKLRSLSDTIPKEDLQRLDSEVERIAAAETVDFSYLPLDEQEKLLGRLCDPGLCAELRHANRELARAIPALLSAPLPDRSQAIEDGFGLRRFAGALGEILDSLGKPAPALHPEPESVAEPASIQEAVVRRFARLEHLRLLYD